MYENDGSPTPGLDKLARNTNPCSASPGDEGADDNGCLGGEDLKLDRAIMAVAVVDTVEAKDIIKATQERLDNISVEERPCEFDQNGNPATTDRCTWEDVGSENDTYWSCSDYKFCYRIFIPIVLGNFPNGCCSCCYRIVCIPFRFTPSRYLWNSSNSRAKGCNYRRIAHALCGFGR